MRSRTKSRRRELNETLAFRVDLVGGFIENENSRVAQNGPAPGPRAGVDRRRTGSRVRPPGIVAVLAALDEHMRVRFLGGRDDFVIRGFERHRSGCCP